MEGWLRFRSRRGRERCREGAERDDQQRPQPSPSTRAPAVILKLSSPGKGMGLSVSFSGWRGELLGRRMASRGRLGPFQCVLYSGGELEVCGFEHRRLGSWAVRSRWHCGLRL
jgi:hypothetical protein